MNHLRFAQMVFRLSTTTAVASYVYIMLLPKASS